MRRVAFQVSMLLAFPILQSGADLAALHRRAPLALRPLVKLAWLPVRGLGLASYRLCEWIAP